MKMKERMRKMLAEERFREILTTISTEKNPAHSDSNTALIKKKKKQ